MGFQYGLSGMNTASKNLDVIGHNIANANTSGFKSSRAQFAELFGSAVGLSGGMNPGQGVTVAAIKQNHSQGGTSITGNNLDVAINGGGFFQLEMPDGSRSYTRAGSFEIDKDGMLVNAQGAKVLAYATEPTTGIPLSQIGPVQLPVENGISGKKTDQISVGINLDARSSNFTGTVPDKTFSSTVNVYNSQGDAKEVNLYYTKTGDNTWEVHADVDGSAYDPDTGTPGQQPIATLGFDNDGKLNGTTTGSLSFEESDGTLVTAVVDFAKSTQRATNFTVNSVNQNGFAPGQLNGVTIGADGDVLARFSNGMNLSQGKLVLANFTNPNALAVSDGGNWIETPMSGGPSLGVPNNGNFGALQSGALEDSNVDLTAELVNMMVAQRTYQANAQTLKTQDQVMSTLVNLR